MGRNFSWTAKVNGKQVADGTVSGTDQHTPERVEQDAAVAVSLRADVMPSDVTVTEKKPLRQQIAVARAARNGH
ncbi:hypothetical protein ABT255_01845 [Streptomyces mirabilis]|uniref:hypothetical protein n=1 Tax=Streptomyces mirabilis TaxID=68239 RepID=UPI0033336550